MLVADAGQPDRGGGDGSKLRRHRAASPRPSWRPPPVTRRRTRRASDWGQRPDRLGLQWAESHQANLASSTLTHANLTGANLTNAQLSSSTLTNANLTGANLTNANLSSSTLTNAKILTVNLTNAQLFLDADPGRLERDGGDGSELLCEGASGFTQGPAGVHRQLPGEGLAGHRTLREQIRA